MNIKEAKEQIKNAMTAYFTKNKYGGYAIPIEKQRPVFLMGPPGIGKTAIMEQIASELDVALLSYSMTHHTRQSALGLPFIEKKMYGGVEYTISEYTMSEIIASVYDLMEATGKKEGILFLDEINCVSETLAPVMLQFLQYKVFGRHRVPDGWIVVTAGNPPEYNNSVREFDIVTWDRLKRVDVEADYEVWKEYAFNVGIHASITTYLDIKKSDFYKIETTVDGKTFVTARGWSDLSDMIHLYEQNDIPVDQNLIRQYLQNPKIAKDFAVYYDLFNKYKSDYQIDQILSGKVKEGIKDRAKKAKFDERFSLVGLILDSVAYGLKDVYFQEQAILGVLEVLKKVRMELAKAGADVVSILTDEIQSQEKKIDVGKKSTSLSIQDELKIRAVISILEEEKNLMMDEKPGDGITAFKLIKKDYDKRVKDLRKSATQVGKQLTNAFLFLEEVFGEGQEMLIFVTELTISYYGAHFISRYGCDEYFKHNKELLFHDRQKAIMDEIANLNLDE